MEIRRVDDYMDALQERFPTVCMEDLKKIVNHGLRTLYRLIGQGTDVFLKHNEYSVLFGNYVSDTSYVIKKLRKKLRMKEKLKEKKTNTPWDGYYYFSLAVKDVFPDKVKAYYVKDEARIEANWQPYLYRIKHPYEGWVSYLDKEQLETAEFIEITKPLYKPDEKGDS